MAICFRPKLGVAMFPEKRRLLKKTVPFMVLCLIIFICYLYFFVDIPQIIMTLERTNLFIYSLAIVFLLLDVSFYALAWHFFMNPLGIKVPFRKTFSFVWIGIFIDILVPAESVSGEISRAFMMSKELDEQPEETGKVVASLISQRILGMILTLGSLIVGFVGVLLLRYEFPHFIPTVVAFITVCISVPLGLLFLLFLKPHWTWKIIDSLMNFIDLISKGRWKLTSLKGKARNAMEAFYKAMKVLGDNPKTLILPVAFSAASWISKLLISHIVFFSIGYSVHFSIILVVYSIVSAIQSIPLGVPAQMGLTEFSMIELYASFHLFPKDINRGVCGAATFLVRAITVLLPFLIGFIVMQAVGIRTLMQFPKVDETKV